MTPKKKPAELKDLKPDPAVDQGEQAEVRGGFKAVEHGTIGTSEPVRKPNDRSPPTWG